MAMSQFPLRQSLADGVHDILIERFMDGTFEPGQPLNIDALARELRVSQTPIREALARLEHTGLVAREALKGYRVAALFTEAELVSLMDARLVLEPVLAAAAALHVDEERISRLDETVQTLRQHAEHPDSAGLGRYWAADELFHSLIAEYAGNPFLELPDFPNLQPYPARLQQFSNTPLLPILPRIRYLLHLPPLLCNMECRLPVHRCTAAELVRIPFPQILRFQNLNLSFYQSFL